MVNSNIYWTSTKHIQIMSLGTNMFYVWKNENIVLSETTRLRASLIADLYQIFLTYAPVAKNGPTSRVT